MEKAIEVIARSLLNHQPDRNYHIFIHLIPKMINYDQAVYFLEEILRMPPMWTELLKEEPLEFLSIYMKRHATRVPFQNLNIAAMDEKERWFPSEEDLISTGLSGDGGCCINLNYFSMLVFQAIGLDTFVVRGDHYCAPILGNHCMVMVRLSEPKCTGTYLIEVGGAYPILEPVPMDKERLPYRTLQAAGFPYEFREIGNGWIGKFHLGGGIMGGEFTDKMEILRVSWDMKPRALWEFDYPMFEVFTNPNYSAVLSRPFMCRYFNNSEFCRLFPELSENGSLNEKVLAAGEKMLNGCATIKNQTQVIENAKEIYPSKNMPLRSSPHSKVMNGNPENGEFNIAVIKNQSYIEEEDDLEEPRNWIFAYKRRIVVGDANSRKIVKNYDTYEEMAVDLKKYFPKILPAVVDKAIKNFNRYEPTSSPFDATM